MYYHFDTNRAVILGVDGAIMLENIHYWVSFNKANNNNFYDGEYWTYNSKKAFSELFPFWSEKQVRRILDNLIKDGYLKKGNYNKVGYDKTLWYTLTEKGWELWNFNIGPNGQMEQPKQANRTDQMVQPIPDNKPYNKTNNNISIEQLEQAEKLWQLYPNKKGKTRAIKDIKKHMKNFTYEQLENAVKAYAAEVAGRDKQYIKHGSTFFKDGILDYLEADDPEKEEPRDVAINEADEEYFTKLMMEQLNPENKL